jgi:hypothetical protein
MSELKGNWVKYSDPVEEDKAGEAGSEHRRDKKYIQNFGSKI